MHHMTIFSIILFAFKMHISHSAIIQKHFAISENMTKNAKYSALRGNNCLSKSSWTLRKVSQIKISAAANP